MHIINLKVLDCQDFYLKFLDNESMKGEIKEKLRALRLDAGYTQKEMAQKIKSTDKNIWAYEKGLATPPAEIIVAYAEAFNVSTDYLLGLEDDFGVKIESKEKKPDALSAEERRLLEGYREINAAGKKLVMQTVETLRNTSAGSGIGATQNKIG